MGIMMISTIISCIIINAIGIGLYILVYHLFGAIPIVYMAVAHFCAAVVVSVEIIESIF